MNRLVSNGLRVLTKSEIIFNKIPSYAIADQFEQTYNQYLDGIKNIKQLNYNEIRDLGEFPNRTFKKLPKYTLDQVIKSTYEVIKSKKPDSIYHFNAVLLSYLNNNIYFDVSAILNDMNNNKIQFNILTYVILVSLYSERGDMKAVQNLVNAMKDNGLEFHRSTKYKIYGGFIRAKQFDNAEQFIKEENIEENNLYILVMKCKAFADIDYFKEMKETLKIILEIDSDLPSKIFLDLYFRLIKSGSSDSNLNETLSMSNLNDAKNVYDLVYKLNGNGFYNYSLKVMLKFSNFLNFRWNNSDVIKTFCNKDCPINVYKTVLEEFSDRIVSDGRFNLFENMDFDTSLNLSYEIMNVENNQCIISNLLTKAIKEKSINNIKTVFHIMENKLYIREVNFIIQCALIPDLLESEIISKADEILNVIPNRESMIVPPLFMYHLCKGDFTSLELLLNEGIKTPKLNQNLYFGNYLAKEILNNVPFIELEKIAELISKVFPLSFVNWLLFEILHQRIIQLSIDDNVIAIKEAIKIVENLGVILNEDTISNVKKEFPKYASLFDQLKITKKLADNSMADDGEMSSSSRK